jgi:hypothetical protein
VQFSPASYYYISLEPKYTPQHFVLHHPHSVLFPQCQRPSFTPMQRNYLLLRRWNIGAIKDIAVSLTVCPSYLSILSQDGKRTHDVTILMRSRNFAWVSQKRHICKIYIKFRLYHQIQLHYN